MRLPVQRRVARPGAQTSEAFREPAVWSQPPYCAFFYAILADADLRPACKTHARSSRRVKQVGAHWLKSVLPVDLLYIARMVSVRPPDACACYLLSGLAQKQLAPTPCLHSSDQPRCKLTTVATQTAISLHTCRMEAQMMKRTWAACLLITWAAVLSWCLA